MKRRYVLSGLGLVAAFALVTTAVAGPGLGNGNGGFVSVAKKKKAKPGPAGPAGPAGAQGAQGPQGPAGSNGTNGNNGNDGLPGADGTARAYGTVNPSTCSGGPPAPCTVDESKNIDGITRSNSNVYCVDVTTVDAGVGQNVALVEPYATDTAAPKSTAVAQWDAFSGVCPGFHDFAVVTRRVGVADGTLANDVAFTFMVP